VKSYPLKTKVCENINVENYITAENRRDFHRRKFIPLIIHG